jgi:hypothetical protein
VTLAAGVVLTVFGGLGAWFLARHFPHARFLRLSYALLAIGGLLFITWSLSKVLAFGAGAALLVAAGGILGVAGALRKELRSA